MISVSDNNEMSKRNNALLWTGIGAATAGIIAVVTVIKLREHEANKSKQDDRDINAVLEDCYRKINEIEEHFPILAQSQSLPRRCKSSEPNVANN